MASRTRTRLGDSTAFYSTLTREKYTGSTRTFTSEYSGGAWIAQQDFGEMRDQTNPGFFKAKREGSLLPVAPMSKTTREYTFSPASFEYFSLYDNAGKDGYRYKGQGALFDHIALGRMRSLAVPVPQRDVTEAILLQEALAYAQTDAWDTLTFLAEFEKTVTALTTLYGRWSELYRRVVHRAQSISHRFKNLADAIASVWLEMRYSFRPLYYDILSINESIQRMRNGVEDPLVRGWTAREGSPSVATGTYDGGKTTVIMSGKNESLSPHVQMGGAVGSFVTYSRTRFVQQRATVGIQVTTRDVTMTDPLVTAWELIPFSFVFDWFISIGDMLAAFSPFATGSFRYATYTETSIDTYRMDFIPVLPNYQGHKVQNWTASPGFLEYRFVTSSRVLRSVTPAVGININLNTAKILDLIALIWSMKLRHLKLLNRR